MFQTFLYTMAANWITKGTVLIEVSIIVDSTHPRFSNCRDLSMKGEYLNSPMDRAVNRLTFRPVNQERVILVTRALRGKITPNFASLEDLYFSSMLSIPSHLLSFLEEVDALSVVEMIFLSTPPHHRL